MDAIVPILATIVALAVGYVLGGLHTKRRRESSLVDDRLRAIDESLNLLATLCARVVQDRAQAVAHYAENTGVVGAGIAAADALAGPELPTRTLGTRMREALELLQPFDTDDKINAQIADKLAEARMEYEALRTNLV